MKTMTRTLRALAAIAITAVSAAACTAVPSAAFTAACPSGATVTATATSLRVSTWTEDVDLSGIDLDWSNADDPTADAVLAFACGSTSDGAREWLDGLRSVLAVLNGYDVPPTE